MNRVYLMRHGRAVESGSTDLADDDRPLTEQGQRRTREIAHGLKSLKVKVDRIVASPLPRASRTAEIVADVLGIQDLLELNDALRADRDAESIQAWLSTRTEERIMLVGHNPTFSELLSLLLLGRSEPVFCNLRKGAVAALVAGPESKFRLDWLARPKIARALGE